MVLNTKIVAQSLKKKGFVEEPDHDHKFYWYHTLDKKETHIFTKISHGSKKDIKKYILSAMARQCKVSTGNFKKLIECSMDQAEYEKLVEERLGRPL